MDRLIFTATTAMSEYRLDRQNMTNDLANVSTTGFKKSLQVANRAVRVQGDGFDTRFLPRAFTSPLIDMKFGPPEQTVKRYFSLTVDDIDMFHKDKIKKWIKVYEKVLGYCFRKIREHVLRDQKFCFFPVPEYLPGFPLYNITHCTLFIVKKLNQAGFKTKYIPPNVIYIFWNVQNHYERVINPQHKQITLQETDKKYKSIKNNNEKEVHYITYQPEQNNIYKSLPSQKITNNNKFAFQQEDPFLFN